MPSHTIQPPDEPAEPPAAPTRWLLHFAIDGDLRFLSHHDCMRVMERLAVRANLPLRYSQGFNPHPVLSLLLPRSVGVATDDDLLVLAMDGPVEGPTIVESLNAGAPKGLRFLSAERMPTRKAPRPAKAFYELPLDGPAAETVSRRLTELRDLPAWSAQRVVVASRGQRETSRPIDLRPLVEDLAVQEGRLRISLVRRGDAWARPAEALALVGLDAPEFLARLRRTGCECEKDRA
jgi:radical SAM-linked protein